MNPTTASLARLDAWLDRLASETDQARHSAAFTAYVQTMARFWRYSQRNTLLIYCQRPDATMVNSRKRWEALGYRVKRGAWQNSIHILCPHFRKERDPETGEEREVLAYFTTGYIYSDDQVEAGENAQPLALSWATVAGDHSALYALLGRVCAHLGLTVALRDDLRNGVEGSSDGKGHIVLNGRAPEGNRAQVLVHEIAHEVCHPHAERVQFSRREAECQAESVAYGVLTALGVTVPNAPQYLALYGVTREVLQANAAAIHRGVACILGALETVSAPDAAAHEEVAA